MLHDRPSILTLEDNGEVISEEKVFGWQNALERARKLKEEYGYHPDAPVCFIYVESELNFGNHETENIDHK